MALITLALAPVALLLMFEIMFLPYHSEWRTWVHRGLLALDLALVWTLWPGYRSGWGVRLWPKRSWRLVWPAVGSAVALGYAVIVATFPDERMYLTTYWLHGSTYIDQAGRVLFLDSPIWYAFIAPVNTLDLHGEDLVDDAKLAHILATNESSTGAERWVATLPLAGRDLTGADLRSADVRHVDFSHAILNRADLSLAWAEKARFFGAQLHQGATLAYADLQGASLDAARLQGAFLDHAQLQGASLDGASLEKARLQGASLSEAQLQGAAIDGARLQGAAIDGARLQGTSLDYARFQGASFVNVCVWRADTRQADWKDTRVELPKTDKIHECDWTAASFAALKQLIAKEVPESDIKRDAMERIEQSLDPTKPLKGEDDMAKIWAARGRETPATQDYEKSLAGQWRKLGCAAEGASYVLHGLIAQLSSSDFSSFRAESDPAKALASAL